MGTVSHTEAGAGRVSQPGIQEAFAKARKFIALYGVIAAAVLAVVVIRENSGHAATGFMWGRACGVLASALVALWLTGRASRGSRAAYLRVRFIASIAPVAIIVIDSIPGVLPAWFIAMQILAALALVPAAFLVNRSEVRAAFPKKAR
ncbi:hypothetical protein ACFY12_20640 [Streptomyces sp. NPDC001339]|uniref:hypothetical protein n=1 Tax=Streptomyces sp. NPDC001339 TaxID=3364563 RepID=UPI003687252F